MNNLDWQEWVSLLFVGMAVLFVGRRMFGKPKSAKPVVSNRLARGLKKAKKNKNKT